MTEGNAKSGYIPLGGMGVGAIGVDQGNRFYNDMLTPIGQGPMMPNSFPVLRVATGHGAPYIRALCCSPTQKSSGPHHPDFLSESAYKQHLSYPILACQLQENGAPVQAIWTYLAPLAPYDHVAAVMPCILLRVRVANPTRQPLLCSIMFCMDNLATEVTDDGASGPAPIHGIHIEPTLDDNRSRQSANLFRGAVAETSARTLKSLVRNAIIFGDRRNTSASARPHLCLGVKEQTTTKISLGAWDPRSTESAAHFWGAFRDTGQAVPIQPGTSPRAGALCSIARIAPGSAHRFHFLLSWHIPPQIYEQVGKSNGYIQHFPNAAESIRYGLIHLDYLINALKNWQKQLTGSALPRPFANAVIDSCRAFVTHTRHTAKNGFVLAPRLEKGNPDAGEWDFLQALALLTFAPRFHGAAVTTAFTTLYPDITAANREAELRRCAEIILSAFADVFYTGNRPRFNSWYPRIISMLDDSIYAMLREALDASKPDTLTHAATMGLWAAAMNAITVMAREQGNMDAEAANKQETFRAALTAGYAKQLTSVAATVQENSVPAAVQIQALAGACFAELLNLETLAPKEDIRALIPRSLADIADNGEDGDQHSARTLTALATLLFSEQTLTDRATEDDTLTTFLADVLNHQSNTAAEDQDNLVTPSRLDLWPIMQALPGVYYNSLQRVLTLRPAALAPLDTSLPVFTPVSLGKLEMLIKEEPDFILLIRLALDTPLTIETMTLRLPIVMRAPVAACLHDNEPVPARQELLPGDGDTRVVLRFRSPLKLTDTFYLRLRESKQQES